MFAAANYSPYSQAKFNFLPDEALLIASCPWMTLTVDVTPENNEEVTAAVNALQGGNEGQQSAVVQRFLGFFEGFPLLNVLPRRCVVPSAISVPYESRQDEILGAISAKAFLAKINPFNDIDVDKALSYLPAGWLWDCNAIEDASRIDGTDTYDPFAVYTLLREKRLEYQVENAHWAVELISRLKLLREENEPKFFKAMAVILAQQYYVTNHCCDCLDPAVKYLSPISLEIAKYQEEELHHDRLILKSIKALVDEEPEKFQYAPEVRLEIEIIKYAAHSCALGFSALVSIMEGTVYPESDPVGDLLLESSKPDARTGVEAHFQINKRGNHTAIPEAFVRELPPVTRKTVQVATRLTEATIVLDAGLARSMINALFSPLN